MVHNSNEEILQLWSNGVSHKPTWIYRTLPRSQGEFQTCQGHETCNITLVTLEHKNCLRPKMKSQRGFLEQCSFIQFTRAYTLCLLKTNNSRISTKREMPNPIGIEPTCESNPEVHLCCSHGPHCDGTIRIAWRPVHKVNTRRYNTSCNTHREYPQIQLRYITVGDGTCLFSIVSKMIVSSD